MSISISASVVLLGAIIAQGIFAAFLLGISRSNKVANRLLGLLVLSFSLWLIDGFFQLAGIYQQDPDFYFRPIFYSLGLGPLLYLYARSLTGELGTISWRDSWHFIPVLLQGGLYLYLTLQTYEFKYWFWFEVHEPFTYSLEFYLTVILLVGYGLAAVWRIGKYQRWLGEHYSEFSRIRLEWLKVVVGMLLVLCVLWSVDVVLRESARVFHWQSINAMIMGLVVLVLSVGGLRQQAMGEVGITPEGESKAPEVVLDPAVLRAIKTRMKTQEDFRNPTLTLKEFAQSLSLPMRLVSQHINQGEEKSFVDFVNSHRVAFMEQRLASGDLAQFTLLAIALDSGFNSKSSFNRAFKRFTGKTPTAYLKAHGLA